MENMHILYKINLFLLVHVYQTFLIYSFLMGIYFF